MTVNNIILIGSFKTSTKNELNFRKKTRILALFCTAEIMPFFSSLLFAFGNYAIFLRNNMMNKN